MQYFKVQNKAVKFHYLKTPTNILYLHIWRHGTCSLGKMDFFGALEQSWPDSLPSAAKDLTTSQWELKLGLAGESTTLVTVSNEPWSGRQVINHDSANKATSLSHITGVDEPRHFRLRNQIPVDVTLQLALAPAIVDVNDSDHVPLTTQPLHTTQHN